MLKTTPRVAAQVLTTQRGRPWSHFTFAHDWKEISERVGTKQLHFHDLRGTAVTMLSEAGCTPQEIATITGHTLKHVYQILEKYLARTRQLAHSAIRKFERSGNKFANRLQTG